MGRMVVPGQVAGWVDKIEEKVIEFSNEKDKMTVNEQLDFIRLQYSRLFLIKDVLDGKMRFEGVRFDFNSQKD